MVNIEFDVQGVREIVDALGATEKQAKLALSRALQRTAATLRRESERGFKSELDLKKLAFIRKRLKSIKLRSGTFEGAQVWYGLNDMPLSYLRGSVRGGKSGGAAFSGKAGSFNFPNGFVVKNPAIGRGKSIYQRKGQARLPIREANAPIKDKMDVYIEDVIFDKIPEILFKHFKQDLTARVRYAIGEK